VYYVADEINTIDPFIAASHDVLGAECDRCYRWLAHKFFRKDSSQKTGYSPRCVVCESEKSMTIAEHTARLHERNNSSHATKAQRHDDQDEFRKTYARRGRVMHTSDVLLKVRRHVPNLYVLEGGIKGDLALYLTEDQPQPKWVGKNYLYLGYIAYDWLPEFSLYEFDDNRDVMIRESERGWRTVLLQFIKQGVLTEQQCDKEFGKPSSAGSSVWYKRLQQYRTSKEVADSDGVN
jgi:hypothetical protein